MSQLIFMCRYIKPQHKVRKFNFVRYIGTRENVEIVQNSSHLPVTAAQQKLIDNILNTFSDAKDMFEYKDYTELPNMQTASMFIREAIDHNIDRMPNRGILMKYFAERPRVEYVGEHGLFGRYNKPINLHKVQKEVAEHTGNVYYFVVSLSREDAARLSYESALRWQDLVKSQSENIAREMRIPLKDLVWYGAFHNQSHHPHIHLVAYSKNPQAEFLTKQGLRNLKSCFATEIFQNDREFIYKEKTQIRDEIKAESISAFQAMLSEIETGHFRNKKLADLITELSGKLKLTDKKKVYGYLSQANKMLIDEIVMEIARDPRIKELYAQWAKLQIELASNYKQSPDEILPLHLNPEFKSIKNAVIREAMSFHDGRISVKEEHSKTEDTEQRTTGKIPTQEFQSSQSESAAQKKIVLPKSYAVTSLLRAIAKIFESNYERQFANNEPITNDKKIRQREAEKKEAQGIKMGG